MSKTITFLEVKRKTKCKSCGGMGEVMVKEDGVSDSTDCQMFTFVCPECNGKKYKMEKKTVSLETFRRLKN